MALTILLVAFGTVTLAQGVTGRLLNDRKKPAIAVRVWVNDGEKQVGAALTDSEGNYQIEPLAPKAYEVFAFALGYDTLHIEGVIVPARGYTCVNYILRSEGNWQRSFQNRGRDKVITCTFGLDQESHRYPYNKWLYPTNDLSDICSLTSGVYQARRGDPIRFVGGSASDVGYVVDGVQIMNVVPERHQLNPR